MLYLKRKIKLLYLFDVKKHEEKMRVFYEEKNEDLERQIKKLKTQNSSLVQK